MALSHVGQAGRRKVVCAVCIARAARIPPPLASSKRLASSSALQLDPEDTPLLPPRQRVPLVKDDPYTSNRPVMDRPGFKKHSQSLNAASFIPPPLPSPLEIVGRLLRRLPEFAGSDRLRSKVQDYGLDNGQASKTIRGWTRMVNEALGSCQSDEQARIALAKTGWRLDILEQSFGAAERNESFANALEAAMTRHYVTFASRQPEIAPTRQEHLQNLLDITDLSNHPFSDYFQNARAMRRQFHLHIGPTNSGKTYNALKALAKAKIGAYAGPLRLLAHEVWERLNLGTVGGLDGKSKDCNLLTGEENRVVSPTAGLLSCTVEMLPLNGMGSEDPYDVVVIDEIQMLADTSRGGAWSNAVLGVRAKEVHLCGDETMLPLLSTLIPSLGDTLELHRYERLTPLAVADKSLEGDLSKVEKGDCVVTFSRTNIFAVKKAIESTAGKKCAVVYGALPPETRADQARNFNDDNAHEEVLVASDAVGMGLNLKIKRIVFESLSKFNGRSQTPLALTQVKQIAGRAGRFGMSKTPAESNLVEESDGVRVDDHPEPGGIVTTLHKEDLPLLRDVLPLPLPPATRMTIDVPNEIVSQIATLLPTSCTYTRLLDHVNNLTLVPPNMSVSELAPVVDKTDILERCRQGLSLYEMSILTMAPMPTRDPVQRQIYQTIVAMYANDGLIDLDKLFERSGLLKTLDKIEATLAILPPLPPTLGVGRRLLIPPIIVASVPSLETLHKALVVYMWLSFRLPIAFPDRMRASTLKDRTEVVLQSCLERLPGLRNKKHHERGKAVDRPVADWRKQYVAPNGTLKMPGSDHKGVLWVDMAIAQRLKNKQVWKSTGVVPQDKWLLEADGRGGGQSSPPPKIFKSFSRKLLPLPKGRPEGPITTYNKSDPNWQR